MINGKQSVKKRTYINILDIDVTIETGNPSLDSLEVSDLDKFLNSINIANTQEVLAELTIVNNLISSNLMLLKERIEQLQTASSSIKFSYNPIEKNNEGNLIIGSESGSLAHIVFNTINGETAKLKEDEIEKIGQVIINTMMINSDIDLTNDQEVSDLVSEIEFKIIDSLPGSLQAGSFFIKKDVLVKEMKALKEEFSSDDKNLEDEDNSDDIENI